MYRMRKGMTSNNASPTIPRSTAFFPTARTKGLNASGNFLASLIFFHSRSDTKRSSGGNSHHGNMNHSQLSLMLLNSSKTGRISSGSRANASSCSFRRESAVPRCNHRATHLVPWRTDRRYWRGWRTCRLMSMPRCRRYTVYLPTIPDVGSAITATSGLLCLAFPSALFGVEAESLDVESPVDL